MPPNIHRDGWQYYVAVWISNEIASTTTARTARPDQTCRSGLGDGGEFQRRVHGNFLITTTMDGMTYLQLNRSMLDNVALYHEEVTYRTSADVSQPRQGTVRQGVPILQA